MGISGILASLVDNLKLAGWTVILDISLVAAILYSAYLLIKETRALRILYGIIILAILYFFAQLLNLTALNFLLRSVFTVTLVAIPVVFQPELRAALERLGRGELLTNLGLVSRHDQRVLVRDLAAEVKLLAKSKIGALIVIERSTGLKDLTDSGVSLNAKFSRELLKTIFIPKSALHDGAVVIRGDKVVAASVFLPLATELSTAYGTRHRAAVGLSKETDAVVIVVSEETGKISLALRGKLEVVAADKLESKLTRLIIRKSS